MQQILYFLNIVISVYMMVVIVRILLTWFRGSIRVPDFLTAITDPYLNWFRQFKFLRIGYLDLSPIAALAVLSILSQVLVTLSRYGVIRLGIILAMIVQVIWSAASFFIIFLIIILVLRLIGYLTNQNTYGGFWHVVDIISQPVLYRINRILFRGKITNFRTGIIVSASILAVAYLILRLLVSILIVTLASLPL